MKMVRKNQTSGLDLINTLVIGKITRRMVLEFSTTKMVTNMKVDGKKINVKAKAHFGYLIPKTN